MKLGSKRPNWATATSFSFESIFSSQMMFFETKYYLTIVWYRRLNAFERIRQILVKFFLKLFYLAELYTKSKQLGRTEICTIVTLIFRARPQNIEF